MKITQLEGATRYDLTINESKDFLLGLKTALKGISKTQRKLSNDAYFNVLQLKDNFINGTDGAICIQYSLSFDLDTELQIPKTHVKALLDKSKNNNNITYLLLIPDLKQLQVVFKEGFVNVRLINRGDIAYPDVDRVLNKRYTIDFLKVNPDLFKCIASLNKLLKDKYDCINLLENGDIRLYSDNHLNRDNHKLTQTQLKDVIYDAYGRITTEPKTELQTRYYEDIHPFRIEQDALFNGKLLIHLKNEMKWGYMVRVNRSKVIHFIGENVRGAICSLGV